MNINLVPNGAINRVHVSQNDVGRTLTFELFNNSTSYTVPIGATVKIQGTKPSGFGFSETCTVSGNVATIDTTEAMTDESGNIQTELSISYDGVVIGTSNFVLAVERNPHPSNTTDGTQITAQSLQVQINELRDEIESGGSGLTDGAKQALLNCFAHVAWIDEHGQDYYDALESALYPPANLTSISCVYTQSGTVYDTDSLDSLKSDLVVTAHYDNSTTQTVTTYTLSGTLTVGTSTITAIYGGQTATFNVTVTEKPKAWYTGVPLTLGTIEAGTINTTTGVDVESDTISRTGFLDIEGACLIYSRNASSKLSTGNNTKFYFYDEDYDFISSKSFNSTNNKFTISSIPQDTKYVRIIAPNDNIGDEATTPYEFVPFATPTVPFTQGDTEITSSTVGPNVNTTTGEQTSGASTRSSQLIPIYGATTISKTNDGYVNVAFYDKDENYMSYVASLATPITSTSIPYNKCAYMRIYAIYTNSLPITITME